MTREGNGRKRAGLLAVGAIAAIFLDRIGQLAGKRHFVPAGQFAHDIPQSKRAVLGIGDFTGGLCGGFEPAKFCLSYGEQPTDAALVPVEGQIFVPLGNTDQKLGAVRLFGWQGRGEFEQHRSVEKRRKRIGQTLSVRRLSEANRNAGEVSC